MAVNKAKVITVASVKGGSGKTTTLLSLAGIYNNLNKKTLIIDLNLYTGDVSASLNLDINKDIYSLYEDLTNNEFDNIDDYITFYNENIHVLSSPKDPRKASKINNKFISMILHKASFKYDVVLIDTSNILNEITLTAFDLSDQIVYVINNDAMNLKGMSTMSSIFNDMDIDNYKIILNNSNDTNRDYFSLYDIKNIIKRNVDYVIPHSFYINNIDKYVLDGTILTLDKTIVRKHKKTIKVYEKIANNLISESKVK